MTIVFVGLDGGERRLWPVPADWLLTVEGCEKIAVEFVEKLKKGGRHSRYLVIR